MHVLFIHFWTLLIAARRFQRIDLFTQHLDFEFHCVNVLFGVGWQSGFVPFWLLSSRA
jgi:hypothetical protein